MILRIDTINKTITIDGPVSVEELIQLIGDHYIFRQYTLVYEDMYVSCEKGKGFIDPDDFKVVSGIEGTGDFTPNSYTTTSDIIDYNCFGIGIKK